MKTAIIITGEVKQIVFTPENDSDKLALGMFDEDVDVNVLTTEGTIYNNNGTQPLSIGVNMCQGDYLRLYLDNKSRILVLSPKKGKEIKEDN